MCVFGRWRGSWGEVLGGGRGLCLCFGSLCVWVWGLRVCFWLRVGCGLVSCEWACLYCVSVCKCVDVSGRVCIVRVCMCKCMFMSVGVFLLCVYVKVSMVKPIRIC